MSTRCYPLFKKGNPQLRIFLPNFWLKLIRTTEPQPPNVVQFMVSMEMTSSDIQNYLEKIYKIPIQGVRTRIQLGEMKQNKKGYVTKKDDIKYAYITMPKNEMFEFPDLFPNEKENLEKEEKNMEELMKPYKESLKRNKNRPGIPSWFV